MRRGPLFLSTLVQREERSRPPGRRHRPVPPFPFRSPVRIELWIHRAGGRRGGGITVYIARDGDDHVIYVGSTTEVHVRLSTHRRQSPWWLIAGRHRRRRIHLGTAGTAYGRRPDLPSSTRPTTRAEGTGCTGRRVPVVVACGCTGRPRGATTNRRTEWYCGPTGADCCRWQGRVVPWGAEEAGTVHADRACCTADDDWEPDPPLALDPTLVPRSSGPAGRARVPDRRLHALEECFEASGEESFDAQEVTGIDEPAALDQEATAPTALRRGEESVCASHDVRRCTAADELR